MREDPAFMRFAVKLTCLVLQTKGVVKHVFNSFLRYFEAKFELLLL